MDYQVIFFQIVLALLLGVVLGIERTFTGKKAGIRTYGLVSMGSTILVIIAQLVIASYTTKTNFDPLSLAGSVMQGIGFLGAGLIIFHGSKVNGLTTAAGIWISAIIGLAVGYKMYAIAVFATFLTLIVFVVFSFFEGKVRARYSHDPFTEDEESEDSLISEKKM